MIRLVFNYNREPMNFIIKDKEIFYSDRRWGNWIRCMPPPENFMKVVALSRNRIPPFLINMFKFTDEEVKEYNEAKDEDALAEIIIRDAKSKGCIFVQKINEEIPQPPRTQTEEKK